MMDNPVADFRRDLMDENNALKASVTATANQNAGEIDALKRRSMHLNLMQIKMVLQIILINVPTHQIV